MEAARKHADRHGEAHRHFSRLRRMRIKLVQFRNMVGYNMHGSFKNHTALNKHITVSSALSLYHLELHYTGCPRRNGQNFGRVFLMLNYTDITQNTYIQSWTVTEIMAREKCGLLGCPRTVSRPWRHTHPLRMPGNEKPLANIGMQWPWRDNGQLRPA